MLFGVPTLKAATDTLAAATSLVMTVSNLKRRRGDSKAVLLDNTWNRAAVCLAGARDEVAKELNPTWHWPWVDALEKSMLCVTCYKLAL